MKNFLKTILMVVVVMFAAIALVGCDDNPVDPVDPVDPTPSTNVKRDVKAESAKLTKMVGEGGSIYVTSLGQADRDYIEDLAKEAYGEGNFTFDNQLKASDVKSGDLVIAVVGYTSKGISGDITQTGEVARAKAFAEAQGINFVLVQLSGKSRRGESTDPIIEEAVKGAKLVLIYDANDGKGADYDGKYSTDWCKNTLLYMFSDEYDMVDYFKIIGK